MQTRHFVNFLTKFAILPIPLQFYVHDAKMLILLLNFHENTVLGYKKWSKSKYGIIFKSAIIKDRVVGLIYWLMKHD